MDPNSPLPQIPHMPLGGIGGIPPGLADILGQLAPAMQGQMADLNNTFDAATNRTNALADTANQIGGQYGQLLNQPWPMTSKWGDFATRLAGNFSQAIAPQMGGQAHAENVIATGQQMLSNQRVARLQALRDNYDKMADAALKSGDVLQQTKMLEKAKLMQTSVDQAAESERARLGRETALKGIQMTQEGETARLKTQVEANLTNYLGQRGVLMDGMDPTKPSSYTLNSAVMTKKDFENKMTEILKPIAGLPAKDIPFDTAMMVNNSARALAMNTMTPDEVNDPVRFANRIRTMPLPAPRAQSYPVGIPGIYVRRMTMGNQQQFWRAIETVGQLRELRHNLANQYQTLTPKQLNGAMLDAGFSTAAVTAALDQNISDDESIDRSRYNSVNARNRR